MKPYESGRESSEYKATFAVRVLGMSVLLGGCVFAALGMAFGAWLSVAGGVSLTGVGAYLVCASLVAYTRARGDVKAAAVRRPADVARRLP